MRDFNGTTLPALFIGLAIALGSAPNAVAGETGTAGFQDARIKTNFYDPGEVYRVVSHFGFVTSIQFKKGETVESVQLGDSVSWSVERLARGDMLSIVPLEEAARGTNMTVTTDSRVYVFDMVARHAASPDAPEMTFLYRFDYPITAEEIEAEAMALAAEAVKVDGFDDVIRTAQTEGEALNGAYRATGAPLLTPAAMIDDGEKTYLRFRKGASHPAAFLVAPDGSESSVNTSTLSDGTLVIHQTGRAFTLRGRGGQTVCIFNDAILAVENGGTPSHEKKQAMAMTAATVTTPAAKATADPITSALGGFFAALQTGPSTGEAR